LKRALELAWDRGVVRKTLSLLVGQTRVHLDDVEGLGQFMELEVVMQEGQSDAEGQAIAEDLMARLGVEGSDLIEGAYMDLLDSR
jgi:adenylate cyclase class IV